MKNEILSNVVAYLENCFNVIKFGKIDILNLNQKNLTTNNI